METWIESKIFYQGRIFSLRVGDVETYTGKPARREIIEHPGGVAIIPIINGNILLIKQFRISIEREIIELPAGRLEAGDSPEERANLELEEELGYRSNRLIPLVTYYSSVGFTNEKMHIFLGLDLEPVEARPEWDENIQLIKLPLKEAELRIAGNEFEDSKTIIGLDRMIWLMNREPDLFANS
jgi:ADP-ribose pyrophosphatase